MTVTCGSTTTDDLKRDRDPACPGINCGELCQIWRSRQQAGVFGQGLVNHLQQCGEVTLSNAILVVALMYLNIETSVLDGGLVGFVDQFHPGAVGYLGEQRLDVGWIQPDTAVGYPHTHPIVLVRSVQEIARKTQAHGVLAERVVRSGWNVSGERAALGSMFRADGRRRMPGGLGYFLDDFGRSGG